MHASPLLALVVPILDRWGGGGFEFLSSHVPGVLKRGIRQLRILGIPAILLSISPTTQGVVCSLGLGLLLSLNLNEIEDRNWIVIFIKSLSLFAFLFLWCGWYACIPALWWPIGIYLSNFGIAKRRLDWAWVELLRGLGIAMGVILYAYL